VTFEDVRFEHGETRMIALAPLKERLHVVCYSQRGAVRWSISFRKANTHGVKAYEEAFER
jgi:uncharacterized DUF497 family protein